VSRPDATAVAALAADVIKPVFFAFLDFVGDPIRANSSGANITPSGTGDADLDSLAFVGISGELIDVSAVRVSEGGSESVTAKVSGLPGIDDDTLELLADPENWQGRNARLWRVIRNAANVQQGGYHNYYTGKMVDVRIGGSATEQIIAVTIETYLAALSQASNRSYLDQEKFDPGDLSAKAAIAIANGNYGALGGSAAGLPTTPVYYGAPVPGATDDMLYQIYRWSGGAPL
jgi:hypothetical protein